MTQTIPKVMTFVNDDKDQWIHIIKMKLPNSFIVVHEDSYSIRTGHSEILTKEEVETKFNIKLKPKW